MNYRELEIKTLEEISNNNSDKFYQSFMETIKDCQYFASLLKKSKKKGLIISTTILQNKISDCADTLKHFIQCS